MGWVGLYVLSTIQRAGGVLSPVQPHRDRSGRFVSSLNMWCVFATFIMLRHARVRDGIDGPVA